MFARFRTSYLLLPALALLALPAAANAADPAQKIAPGVTAGGVDLSGLTVSIATRKLERELAPQLQRVIAVRGAGRRSKLHPSSIGLKLDANRTAQRALYVVPKDERNVSPTAGGAPTGGAVQLAITFSGAGVNNFVQSVRDRGYRAPRNADVVIGITKMKRKKGHFGRGLRTGKLASKIRAALVDPSAARSFTVKSFRIKPRVTVKSLARQYPTILTVDRRTFKLRLFKRLRRVKTYTVAVGASGTSTPAGTYHIRDKTKYPAWSVPNESWAGDLAGTTVPGGAPNNPLKARWLGIKDGVGIHGTGEPWSVGSAASHGCIRMRVSDVKNLYPKVPVGTPVRIR